MSKEIEKFKGGLINNSSIIKKGLEIASDHYNKVIGSIENRVIPQIKKMSKLGAMSDKNIQKTPHKAKLNIRDKKNS